MEAATQTYRKWYEEEERERGGELGGWIIIEAGVCCSINTGVTGKRHTLRQGLSGSELAHSQIWGAGVLNHPAPGATADR